MCHALGHAKEYCVAPSVNARTTIGVALSVYCYHLRSLITDFPNRI